MQFNPLTYAVTKTFIDTKGLIGPQDSSSIAAVASLLGNPVVSLFAGQAMAEKRAAELVVPPATPVPPPAATGAPAVAVVGTPATAGGSPSPPAGAPAGSSASPPAGAAAATTIPTGAQFEKAMKDMSTRASEFIAKAEKQLADVQQAAREAAQAAREARDAAIATLAKVQDSGHAGPGFDTGTGSLVGAGGKVKK